MPDVRGQKRIARLDQADRKAQGTQRTSRYNQGMPKNTSEHTTCLNLEADVLQLRLQATWDHQNLITEDWPGLTSLRIWRQQHEHMDPSCLVSAVQAAGGVDFLNILWTP